MPAVLTSAAIIGEPGAWNRYLERGIDDGLEAASEAVRDRAAQSLAAHVDPWGAAFAPVSPLTLKLRATEGQEVGVISGAFLVRKSQARKWALTVNRRASDAAWTMQHGSQAKHVFDNANTVTQPARAFLPVRNGRTDIPPDLLATLQRVMEAGVSMALARDAGRR